MWLNLIMLYYCFTHMSYATSFPKEVQQKTFSKCKKTDQTNHKPPIWEWFIAPMHGEIGHGLNDWFAQTYHPINMGLFLLGIIIVNTHERKHSYGKFGPFLDDF